MGFIMVLQCVSPSLIAHLIMYYFVISGFHSKAIRVLQRMQQKLPKMVEILNQMAVTYLIMGQNNNAKEILEEVI